MEIYVVRHGQTDYNVQGFFQGHIDIPLNNIGIEQAKETALKFKNIKVDKILVSPLKRARQTAQYISEITGIEFEIEERLIERSFGNMEGCTNRPDWNIQMMLDYNRNYTNENVEPIQSLFKRVYKLLEDIVEKYKNKSVILVTHGGVSQAIDCYFLGMPEKADYNYFMSKALKNCEVRRYMQRKLDGRDFYEKKI